ncbi:hypothetical protein [Marinobacter caseinilyticus]|uniref:hypothetical protein n=1 Tax=Marinobacter caseinilyticus TaxID=2692195 RepID=UPI001409C28B|nr:hypothetical protein [Marinobacter caseinilyticus]
MKFLLVLAVIAVIVLVVLKKQPQKGNKHSRKRVSQAAVSKEQTNFHATKIVPGDNACQAAQDLQDKLFLDSKLNTPNLPLPDCTQASDCHCKYDHQGDRRSDESDRRLHSLQTELYPAAEGADRRRQKRGCRTTD